MLGRSREEHRLKDKVGEVRVKKNERTKEGYNRD